MNQTDNSSTSGSVIPPHRLAFKTETPGVSAALTDAERIEVATALDAASRRMGDLFQPNQILGRHSAIGCVALEITQRCNLDCSLCYLSEHSEHVRDVPLSELFRRLERIKKTFGVGTVVQITGGDPTLRPRNELLAIVRRARALGLPPALFTNGIKASRALLEDLTEAGLNDVAFHVDLTQKRKGYDSEQALNAIREEYIERGRGLPLKVMFNTTVHRANFTEIPDLVQFFVRHADVVCMTSFQLQADTGRGTLRKRDAIISLETVREQIDRGAGRSLAWDTVLVGHPQCHSYAPSFEVNGHLYPVIDDKALFGAFLNDFRHVQIDRRASLANTASLHLKAARSKPWWYGRALGYGARQLWKMKRDLLAARGRVNKISFFVQNFMDADALDPKRLEACSFMVVTAQGPLSMCAHNARRDDFILQPFELNTPHGRILWNPLREKKQTPTKTHALQTSSAGCGGCSRC